MDYSLYDVIRKEGHTHTLATRDTFALRGVTEVHHIPLTSESTSDFALVLPGLMLAQPLPEQG